MIAILLFSLLVAQATTGGAAAPASNCAGADPAVVSAAVKSVSPAGTNLNEYHIGVTVTNVGGAAQSKDALQFVDIFAGNASEKLDAKGVPPLAVGQSYTIDYVYQRARDAGANTTTLKFTLDMRSPAGIGAQNCSAANDTFSLTF